MLAQMGHMTDAGRRAFQGCQSGQHRIAHGVHVHDKPKHNGALFLSVDTGYLVDVEGETHVSPREWLYAAKSRGEYVCNGNRFCECGSHSFLLPSPSGPQVGRQFVGVLANHEPTLSLPSVAHGFGAVKAVIPAVEINKLHASLESKS